MAEVTNTDGTTPVEGNVGPSEAVPQANPRMIDELGVKTIAKIETEVAMPQVLTTEPANHDMPAPEAFTPGDLAMESNPTTTAEAFPLEHMDSNTVPSVAIVAAEPSPELSGPSVMAAGAEPSSEYSASSVAAAEANSPSEYAGAYGKTAELPNQAETSASGWLVPPAATPTSRITFDDYLTLSEITFEWGDSYDCKDWMRLGAILAPTLMVDYTEVNGHKWDSMPASDFVGILSHIGFVGDPLVHTQHHIGASKWQKISSDEVIGHHQLRAAHQRYTNLDLNVVENKGHGHAMVKHYYRKLNGEWKLAGLTPAVRWNEFEFDKIFKGF